MAGFSITARFPMIVMFGCTLRGASAGQLLLLVGVLCDGTIACIVDSE
jgi:hypothetical protein